MADYTVREGDNFTIADTLEDAAGAAVDINGHSIKFTLIPLVGGAAILNDVAAQNDQVGAGGDGSKGKVHYTGSSTGWPPGLYLASWRNSSTGQAFPNGGYILFEVTADAPIGVVTRFAESTDVERRLGISFTADEHIRAQHLLERASGLIQQHTRQTIALVTGDTVTRPGSYESRLRLKERPVVSVASVTLNGVALVQGIDYYIAGDELVRRRALPEDSFGLGGSGWGYPWQDVVIVYTHGYSVAPDLVRGISVEMVIRAWTNPAAVIQEGIAGVVTTYAPYQAPPRGLLLTAAEKIELNDLFGRPVGTITLR